MICSGLGLLLLSPILLLVVIGIYLDDRGPVFFMQNRVGKDGVCFKIWKFRTMTVDAEQKGTAITIGEDRRITKVGRWLRSTKIDELPQLINVVLGEMSLVGPRPEVPKYVAMYTPEQRRVLLLTPGITDVASLKYRDENAVLGQVENPEEYYISMIMPDKISLNLKYAESASAWSDFKVILMTVGVLAF